MKSQHPKKTFKWCSWGLLGPPRASWGPPKLKDHKMRWGEVFRPYLKMPLIYLDNLYKHPELLGVL